MSTTKPMHIAFADMHATASHTLGQIAGIAKCALLALESPSVVSNLESIAQALQAIAGQAAVALDDVDSEAERCGIETVSPAWERRLNATHSGRN